jgi:hypothetical protein
MERQAGDFSEERAGGPVRGAASVVQAAGR